jgi:predicted NodU family carbamoyl transferase
MIVGLHNGHDACISIMDNGIILGHWELERLTGKKHIAGWFHKNLIIDILIQKILPQLQATIQDIEFICLSSLEMENHWNMTELSQILKNANKVNNLSFEWKSKWRNKEIKFFAFLHHLNHMAYSYYTCPWNNAFIFAYDGKGDFGSTTCYGIGKENKLQFIFNVLLFLS